MMKKWSFILFAVAVILSVVTQRSFTVTPHDPPLQLNFYRNSCPKAEMIIRSTVDDLYMKQSSVAPALVRLFFHDCFIMGCDASVLLNSTNGVPIPSERDEVPNQSLKGFEEIEEIKSRLESECPGVVSCSDILVVAAGESVFLSGGPLFPIQTGRRDSLSAFPKMALSDIPSPNEDLSAILKKFSARHFSPRETVSLLGVHSIGKVNCNFLTERLNNFNDTGKADSTIEREFLNTMKKRCADLSAFIDLKKDGAPEEGFGTHYYQGLVQERSVLRSDQELMNDERTASWVRAYASNQFLFAQDFSNAMAKLSNNGVLTGQAGEIRVTCSSTL